MGQIRIIAGTLKGRKIPVPRDPNLRPTSAKAREALFSILGSQIEGAFVLDAFAGSGALGFEALSRGARAVWFLEQNPKIARQIANIAESWSIAPECFKVEVADASRWVSKSSQVFDLILADPPYQTADAEKFIQSVARGGVLHPENGQLVVENAKKSEIFNFSGLSLLKSAKYGDSRLDFYRKES